MVSGVSGKVVVLVGSTGGLGTNLAEKLYSKGAKIAVIDLDEIKVEAQSAEIPGSVWAVADVTKTSTLEAAFKKVHAHFGTIDIVLAIAGIEVFDPTLELEESRWLKIVDINLNGVWRTFKVGAPYVKATKGYLGAVSSMAAFVHAPYFGAYSATKAGVLALCNSVRNEMKVFGVGVGSFHPTFFESGLLNGLTDRQSWMTLWKNHTWPFKKVNIDAVTDEIVRTLEKRGDWCVVPSSGYPIAWLSNLIGPIVDRLYNVKHVYDLLMAE